MNEEVVGFLGYDHKDDRIDNVYIRIIEKAQNKGIGTLFLSNLIRMSKKFCKSIFIVVIKTNPAQSLYKRLGFKLYEVKDALYFFRYNP